MITRRPILRRQKKIFRHQGKMPRPDQLNINVATWGRLLKRNLNFQKSLSLDGSGSTRSESVVSRDHTSTGKSLSYALISASTNPQYDNRLFIELQVQYMKFFKIIDLKFTFPEKATKIDKIFTVNLTVCSNRQIVGEDFVNFCGLLRKPEL